MIPGKSQTRSFFFISIVQWNVEEDDTIISKAAKGKGKTRGKNGKLENVPRSKMMNRQTALKIMIGGHC